MKEEFKILSNGIKIPTIGFGTYKSGDDNLTAEVVKYALDIGYKMIDTASFYGNEKGVGDGIKLSKVKREEIFLVTKLWNEDHGYEKTMEAFNQSLKRLQVDYIDLYLIHWPNKLNAETWRAFEDLYNSGKVKAIGVSNFKIGHLEDLKKTAKIMPMVNQIEVHPLFTRDSLVKYCEENNIQVVAWSPIMRGKLLDNESLKSLGNKYNKTIAEIILRWHLQRGIIPIPKSSNKERIKENFNIFDFNLSSEDMEKIDELNEGEVSVTGVPDNTTYLEF